MVQGSLRNLRALTSLYSDDVDRLERALRRHISEIFSLQSATPIDLVSALGAMIPWHAVHAQEHERLYLQLSNSLYPSSPAVRVFRLAQAEPRVGASFAKRNWARSWEQQRNRFALMGVPLAPLGTRYELIPAAAKRFGRAVAFVDWQRVGRRRVTMAVACDAGAAPTYRPIEAVAQLYENYRAPIASLGDHHDFTPLSAHGPGCSGSIPTRSNIAAHRLGPIAWARTGAAVMRSPLFNLGGNDEPIDYAAHARPCPLCGVSPVDVFHFIAECSHSSVCRWRARLVQSSREFVPRLVDLMARERARAGHPPEALLFRRIRRTITNTEFDSPEGDFILYRLLVAQPWPERLAGHGMRAVRLLGRTFDLPGMFHRFERPILDAWCRWSLNWLWALSRAWRLAKSD